MAFPKRHSRRIVIAGEMYVWYLNGNYGWEDGWHIAVCHAEAPNGQLLLLDMYRFAFEIRPRTIREAIEFVLANGWNPKIKAAPLYVGHDNIQFVLLPSGQQYTREYKWPPSVTWLEPHDNFFGANASQFNPDSANGRALFAGPPFEDTF